MFSSSDVPANVHLTGTVHTCPDDGIETVSGLRFLVRLQDASIGIMYSSMGMFSKPSHLQKNAPSQRNMHSNVLPAQAREYLWFAKNAERAEAPERVRQRSADQASDMSGDLQSLRETVRVGRDKFGLFGEN